MVEATSGDTAREVPIAPAITGTATGRAIAATIPIAAARF
jgi:hypothetical protein